MTFAAAAAFCSAKTINQAIPFDDTRHLAVTADDAIGLARRHALGAGVDEGLEFRFEMGFPGPSRSARRSTANILNSITL